MMRATPSILPLHLHDICYTAGGERLFGPFSYTFEAGRTLALLGPNGAGKSLLLRLCHGLIQPSSGQITWQMANGQMAGRKRHAMVFQKPIMLRRSALENVVHACCAGGLTTSQANRRAQETLARFGLNSLARRPARLLSGGEQQRLAIARAAALAPDVLFLDEPTAQLDPSATRQIEAMLQVLITEGVTLIFASHDLAQAKRLADDVIFLYRGRSTEYAPAAQFFTHPQTNEAKAFISGDLLW